MLNDLLNRKVSKIITLDTHKELEQRVNNLHNPLLGYWDAQKWVNETYGVDVKYSLFKLFLIHT